VKPLLTVVALAGLSFGQTTKATHTPSTPTHTTSTPNKASTHSSPTHSTHSSSTHSTHATATRRPSTSDRKQAKLQRRADDAAAAARAAREEADRYSREVRDLAAARQFLGLTPPQESAAARPIWNGKKFDPEFFASTFGKAHKFPLDGGVRWQGTPYRAQSVFAYGGQCFVLQNSIPLSWWTGDVLYTFVDESCRQTWGGDEECSYFITDYNSLGQWVPISITSCGLLIP